MSLGIVTPEPIDSNLAGISEYDDLMDNILELNQLIISMLSEVSYTSVDLYDDNEALYASFSDDDDVTADPRV